MIARAGRPSLHAAGTAAAALFLLAAAALWPVEARLFACPFRAATGLPCLTCGFTHAFHAVARGAPLAALRWSPLGALLALGCAAHAGWTALRFLGLPFVPVAPAARHLRGAAVVAILCNWVFLLCRGMPA